MNVYYQVEIHDLFIIIYMNKAFFPISSCLIRNNVFMLKSSCDGSIFSAKNLGRAQVIIIFCMFL